MRSATALALAASLHFTNAYQGFNYASDKPDGSSMELQDWKDAFSAQANLEGTGGAFTSARLYTMLRDAQTSSDPILAIQAAADDGTTSLLLGLWTSGGQAGVDKEIAALVKTIEDFPDLHPQIAGISVGSEDLYRNSKIANKTNEENPDKPLGPGVNPDVMLSYVNQVIGNLTGEWIGIPVGHVDTWTAITNSDGSFNDDDLQAFNDALDFIGVDAYPYFQKEMSNGIDVSTSLFNEAYQKVLAVAGDADVWITETGWPSSGDQMNEAVASVEDAQLYWQGVGCANFGKINTWWYTFFDDHQEPSFGVVKSLTGGTPSWDLSCDGFTDAPDAAQGVVTDSTNGTSTSGSHNSTISSNHTSSGTSPTTSSSSSSSNTDSGRQSAGVMITFSGFVVAAGAFAAMVAVL